MHRTGIKNVFLQVNELPLLQTFRIGHVKEPVSLEAAVVFGPLSVQSEYAAALVNRAGAANPGFDAFYVAVSYFLTGEHRVYNRTLGTFGRLNPIENAFRVRDGHGNVVTGKGAWQLAYRYGYIDLIDTGVNGNRAGVHTMGVNWYLTPYARLMAHYTCSLCNVPRADHPGGAGNSTLQAMLVRLHFDF